MGNIRSLYFRANKFVNKTIHKPHVPLTSSTMDLKKIGTPYGGWTFLDHPNLLNSTIVSAGAGEDISFDVGFAKEYNSTVIIVDPTPRAIEHVEGVQKRIINKTPPTVAISNDGKQNPEAYDLKMLTKRQICLEKYGLWHEEKILKFYMPVDSDHVSHSIVNLQKTENFIEISAIPLEDILHKYDIKKLPLLKMDIEGAEIEVINDMIDKKILPDQVLVEFDDINSPSAEGKYRVEYCYNKLIRNGYNLVYIDNGANFLFLRETIYKDGMIISQ